MQADEVSRMFSIISRRYDFLNHLMSFGLDAYWRKRLVSLIKPKPGDLILDVASGTGDVAIELARQFKNTKITGVDFSNPMLQIAKKKVAILGKSENIKFQFGDALNLPFKDNKFEAATMAFGIRNVENCQKGIKEMKRVVKKGGLVLILEFSRPNNFITPFYWLYLKLVIPTLGGIFSKKQAYLYLSSSIWQFINTVNIADDLKELGFIHVKKIPLTLGVVSIYIGEKAL